MMQCNAMYSAITLITSFDRNKGNSWKFPAVIFRYKNGGYQGTSGVPLTYVGPWYLAGVLQGFLEIITHKYPLYRAYVGISHRGTLGFGVHLTIP